MGDIQTRPFSKNYSGLINQSVIAIGITVLCVTGQELMKRARRGKGKLTPRPEGEGLGSRESWEFGYLYQGRSWARYPSPPSPAGWPLAWVPQVIRFPEAKLNRLRGIDAALYIRFLRGSFWFTLLHTFTTFPILFPIHLEFSENTISPKSMTRASISSLVSTAQGLSLLWIHICLLFWITLSWMATLFWISHGAFRMRAENIAALTKDMTSNDFKSHEYHPHPHPQYNFADVPSLENGIPTAGLRLRTIMVSNVPPQLRDEKELKEYFEYYMSRKLEKPALGVNSTTQPGFFNKGFAFLFNRAKKIPARLPTYRLDDKQSAIPPSDSVPNTEEKPVIERVVIARKMTELASLLERREEILRLLETAHIKLAKKVLNAVKEAMDQKNASKSKPVSRRNSRATLLGKHRKPADPEEGTTTAGGDLSEEERMDQLINVLGPFVEEFGLRSPPSHIKKAFGLSGKYTFKRLREDSSQGSDIDNDNPTSPAYPPASPKGRRPQQSWTVWDALLSLPRSSLDPYQPLVRLSYLFRDKSVPSIDYYTTKLNLLTALITENRAKPVHKYDPVSTAFVTFVDPEDARRACKYLTVHPNNPLACLVTMAPQYQDLDWHRVMKSSLKADIVKDWVVGLGVWAFTIFWLFPVSLLVGLVSIQNISTFWPALKAYLDKHAWEEEVIQSFLPTLLVALLALLIPLILLLIAKKAHTITTLSALHDIIMTRYYKFLIVNVLVFFCVGTAALQSVLNSFGASTRPNVLNIVATSFPSAGPFYVGWLIFTLAIHGAFEIALLGLPLIMYPTTRRQVTPRKRAVGIRPRTFNYYYWLPTHLLVIHVLLLFSVLNPFVIPFGAIYFFIESGVVKNQLIHVYAKNYEGNGQLILIRVIRYSLDGLILAQAVFLAYMVVLKKSVNVGLAAFLIVFTTFVKLFMTRMCRARFEHDDMTEARIVCGGSAEDSNSATPGTSDDTDARARDSQEHSERLLAPDSSQPSMSMLRMPEWVSFSYATIRHRPRDIQHHIPIPFPHGSPTFSRLNSLPTTAAGSSEKDGVASDLSTAQSCASPAAQTHTCARPVSVHPPPVSWDDQTTRDLPYDNPYYTRAINNVLWLPRDPCGTLDLDDTVDLQVAISFDPVVGRIGTWIGIPAGTGSTHESPILSPYPLVRSGTSLTSMPSEPGTALFSPTLTTEPKEVDGTEDIDLPEILTLRAQQNDDVERTTRNRRPSTFRERTGASSFSGRSNRCPSAASARLPLSPSDGLRSDAHAETENVVSRATASHLSLEPPPLKRAANISAHEAIYHEVLAEEKQAIVDRLEEEQTEADKKKQKSWLTSWIFKTSE